MQDSILGSIMDKPRKNAMWASTCLVGKSPASVAGPACTQTNPIYSPLTSYCGQILMYLHYSRLPLSAYQLCTIDHLADKLQFSLACDPTDHISLITPI